MDSPVQEPKSVGRRMLTATLTKSILLSSETKHLEFEASELTQFNFTAGQFVTIREPKPDGKIHSRAYSIASPPRDNPTFDICLNRVDNGFMSNWLCDLEIGASITFHGPHGLFVMREPRAKGLFIATGTGIAPFRSMAQWLFADPHRNQGHEYWLVYGTRYEDGIYYREEFEEMQRRHPNFHYVATLSRCRDDWQGCRGYVQDYVRQIVSSHGSMQAYICGLNDMVDANRKLLTEEFGWDKKQIVFERYD
ncbi:MAG: FAD-dependent oxidoreductase [Candidatus Korobacteraceae bacterium]